MRNFIALIGFIVLCFAVAGIGGMWTSSSVGDWYRELSKPAWTPPSWVFGPVWTVLYLMMAVAAWLVWKKAGFGPALGLFLVQLALNLAWSGLFFGMRNPGLAMIDIAVLWVFILLTIVAFRPISTTAAVMMIPYLVWVSYASALNFSIWRMN